MGQTIRQFCLLKDMTYSYDGADGLAYASPVRGAWNIVHLGTLIPECHQIYVCPTSCLRGVVLTTAEMNAMDRLSTIAVGEDNILDGAMEERLQEGVEKVIADLPVRPRMILIFTSCIHHFMAVNYQRVYKVLRSKYPDIVFVDAYMDPIMRKKTPPIPSLKRQMHRALQPAEHRASQVNYIGNCFPMDEYCDLTGILTSRGVTVKDLTKCRSFDEFREMEKSCLNLTFHRTAALAGRDLELRCGQKWIALKAGYDFDEIDAETAAVCQELGVGKPDADRADALRQQISASLGELRELLKDTPVSIDYTAVENPLELAAFLSRNGIRTESVFTDVFAEPEGVFEQAKRECPDLKVYPTENWTMRVLERGHAGKVLAVGQKAAYFNNTDYFVDIVDNAGMYGYAGILHLLELMKDAALHTKPMQELVQIKGWGCTCA